MPDILSVVLRALSFVMLFQAAGVAIFVAIFGRRLESSLAAVRHLGQVAAVAGLVLVAGHYALEAARMTSELSGMWDNMQGMVWNSSARTAVLLRLVGLLFIAIGLHAASGRARCRSSARCSPSWRSVYGTHDRQRTSLRVGGACLMAVCTLR